MKRTFLLFICIIAVFSCKKEKKVSDDPLPEPAKTGTVVVNVTTFDSLGDLENDRSGVKVSLYQTAFSATTGVNGMVSFSGVTYGTILPQLIKYGYDGAPAGFVLNNNSLEVNLPCAKYSAYKINNLSGQVINKDSIMLSFTLDRPIAAGKACKIAVLYSSGVCTPANFEKADSMLVYTQNVQRIDIAGLPLLRAALADLKINTPFFINVVPVSYGIFQSNVLFKQVLIGDNPYPPVNLDFTKNWQ